MRELTALEVSQVSGGTAISKYAVEGGALGTIFGGVMTNTLGGAVRAGPLGAVLGATFGIAYETTSWIIEQVS